MALGLTFTDPGSGVSTAVEWNGGAGMFAVQGTFSAATLTLQHKLGAVWQDIGPSATLTASGATLFTTGATQLQVVNTSHTPSVTVSVIPVYENKAL